jgi:hypothetical protein
MAFITMVLGFTDVLGHYNALGLDLMASLYAAAKTTYDDLG